MATKLQKPIRYAVIGLGHIAQAAVLPAFAHARTNSRLAAMVSDDPVKLRELAREYEYSEPMTLELTVDGRTQKRSYPKRDQFAAELLYFSDCVLSRRDPESSGIEGLLDVHIIRSLLESGQPVELRDLRRRRRPGLQQAIYRAPVTKPRQVRLAAPTS